MPDTTPSAAALAAATEWLAGPEYEAAELALVLDAFAAEERERNIEMLGELKLAMVDRDRLAARADEYLSKLHECQGERDEELRKADRLAAELAEARSYIRDVQAELATLLAMTGETL